MQTLDKLQLERGPFPAECFMGHLHVGLYWEAGSPGARLVCSDSTTGFLNPRDDFILCPSDGVILS